MPVLRSRVSAVLFGLSLVVSTFLAMGPATAMKIQAVKSPGGVEAWLVEEHGLPLVSMQFGFKGGSAQDPADKPGIANFITAMMDEGAGDLDAQAFQQKQEELAMRMSFDAGRDEFTGSFQTMSQNLAAASDLLRLALTKARFDKDSVERMRKQLLAGLAFDAKDPDKIANDVWFAEAYPNHPYGQPVNGTPESLARIQHEDLKTYRDRVFARDNLKISVVGDIDAAALGQLLDKVFGDLPAKAQLQPVGKIDPQGGPKLKTVDLDVPQSVAQFGQLGLARNDPDFIPAFIANYILGGGGLSSRLMEEVREKRGLAYSVYSYLQSFDDSSVFGGGVATKTAGIGQSLDIIKAELTRMAKDGPSAAELQDAKQYLTGSYALRFDSSNKIASQLLGIQLDNLGIDYVDKRNSLIEAVTIDDVKRVAARLIAPDKLIVTVVGRPGALEKASTTAN